MFKVGDFVIGEDRGYKRSIYKIIRFGDPGEFDLLFCALGGRLGRPTDISEQRAISEFRLATDKEVFDDIGVALKHNFAKFMRRLLKVKRSSLVRRSLGLSDHPL